MGEMRSELALAKIDLGGENPVDSVETLKTFKEGGVVISNTDNSVSA